MVVPEHRPLWGRVLYRSIRVLVLGVAKLFGRVEIIGADHLPKDTPFVLAPVHRSNIDFALAALVTRRRMRYMGKDSIWKIKALGPIWNAMGAFPVHRGSADREALRTCVAIIDGGEPLVMFPEGTRQSGPVVQELFDGTAYVASKTGVPIVPVGIGGSEKAMPKGAKFIHPSKIVIVVGEPLDPPTTRDGGGTSRRAVKATTEQLRIEIQKQFDEARARAGD
jgi:1-acyl-sn-glycerol-3-phosphate acyltransferase